MPGSPGRTYEQDHSQSALDCGSSILKLSTHSTSQHFHHFPYPDPAKPAPRSAKYSKKTTNRKNTCTVPQFGSKKKSVVQKVPATKPKKFEPDLPMSKVSAVVSAMSYSHAAPPWIPEYSYLTSDHYHNNFSDPVLGLHEKLLMEKCQFNGLINDNAANMASIRKQNVVKASFEKYVSSKKN